MSAFHLEISIPLIFYLDRFPVIVTLYFKPLKTKKKHKIKLPEISLKYRF